MAVNIRNLFFVIFSVGMILFIPMSSIAEEIRVAVASNFKNTMLSIARKFEKNSDHNVVFSFGSTGKHYAQIKNGAPFDAFFAADVHRPELLEQEGVSLPGSRFTYAIGKVILWSPKTNFINSNADVLQKGKFRYLALANPRLAPYGKAAKEVLQGLKLWQDLNQKIVRGENISQTYQFVKTGNADLGFVAYSQVKRPNLKSEGSYWVVPQSRYTPIEQQAIALKDNVSTRMFMSFVRSEQALKIIHDFGYDTP